MEAEEGRPDEPKFFTAFKRILNIPIPENQPPILFKYKTPERRIAEQAKAEKELRKKQADIRTAKESAHVKTTNTEQEDALKSIALKGVVKLFNDYQSQLSEKKEKEKTEEEQIRLERIKRKMRMLRTKSHKATLPYTKESTGATWDVLSDNYMYN